MLHHLQAFAPDSRNPTVLSGFKARGTRGAALAGGAERLRIFAHDVPIQAEVVSLQSLSAHADADEMLAWLGAAKRSPEITYVTHGEPDAAGALRARIKREFAWAARVPEHLERVSLTMLQATDRSTGV